MAYRLSHGHLVNILKYNLDTGLFTYRRTIHSHALKGQVAGTKTPRGYIRIQIDGVVYPAHRLAWFYVTAEWPSAVINHRDRNKANNAFKNLRDVSRSVAMQNQAEPHKGNKSGFIGATYHAVTGKWAAQIVKKGVRERHLGLYDTPAEAARAYQAAKAKVHPDATPAARKAVAA